METRRILIADEDTQLLSVLALHLRNEGYDVIRATEGIEVLEAARREQPDVIVLNVSMRVGERHFLHQRLVEHTDLLAIPVLYLVDDRLAQTDRAPVLPDQSTIRKPVATSDLLAKLEAVLPPVPAEPIEPRPEAA